MGIVPDYERRYLLYNPKHQSVVLRIAFNTEQILGLLFAFNFSRTCVLSGRIGTASQLVASTPEVPNRVRARGFFVKFVGRHTGCKSELDLDLYNGTNSKGES